MAVSFALNQRPGVSDELRSAVKKVADELGYHPNYAARALRTERTNMMGIINRNLRNPAFLDVIEGFDDECSTEGYQVMIGSSRLDPAHELTVVDAFAARDLEGLAIAPLDFQAARHAWQRKSGYPLAVVSATAPRDDPQVVSVRSDVGMAARLAIEHLHELGHTRIAMLKGDARIPVAPEWERTFEDEMLRRDLQPRFIATGWEIAEAQEIIAAELKGPLRSRPTAIISSSDHLAHAVYLAARENGLRIPDDLSVVGHDDVHTSTILDPPLTTFRSDRYAIGQMSARLLIDIARGGTPEEAHVDLPVSLKVRQSTGPAPANR